MNKVKVVVIKGPDGPYVQGVYSTDVKDTDIEACIEENYNEVYGVEITTENVHDKMCV